MNIRKHRVAALVVGVAAMMTMHAQAADDARDTAGYERAAALRAAEGSAPASGVSVQVKSFQTMPTSPGSAWIEDPQKNQPGLRSVPGDDAVLRHQPFDER